MSRRVYVVKRYVLFIALFFLLVPVADAYSIDRAWLEWNGFEVKTLSPTKSLPNTALKFSISSDFDTCFDTSDVCALLISFPSLNIENLRIDVRSSCTRGEIIECQSQSGTFQTNGTAELRYYSQVGPDRNDWQTVTIPITLDETNPEVSSITTGYCEEETCYVATGVPTPVTIEMTDSVTSFEYKLVFLGGGGAISQVQECTGSTCKGEITTPCTDGQTFTIGVQSLGGVSSREDAQNDVLPGSGQQVVCAGRAPEILDWQMEADGIAGLAVSGGSITVTATVRPTSIPHITGIVNASGISTGAVEAACRPASDDAGRTQTCTWQLTNIVAGKYDLFFEVHDAVGNYAVLEDKNPELGVQITVLNLTTPENNQSLDMFKATVLQVQPDALNRMVLDLARSNFLPYPLYVTYEVQSKTSSAILVSQQLGECTAVAAPAREGVEDTNKTYSLFSRDEQETKVLDPHQGVGKNRLDLQIRTAIEDLAEADTFEVTCTLEFVVRDELNVYSVPELEKVTFQMHLRESPLGTPGDAFVKKIKHEEDKLGGSDQQFLLKLREIRATMDGICTTIESINGAIDLMTGITSVLTYKRDLACSGAHGPVSPLTCASLETAVHSTDASGETAKVAKEPLWFLQGKFIRHMCYQVNCRGNVGYGLASKITEMQGGLGEFCDASLTTREAPRSSYQKTDSYGAGKDGGVKFDVCNGISVPNVEDSFIMSALSLCAGGMIYNAGKWQDINCGYLQCLKEQSLDGSSTAVCESAKSHKLCTQFVGEVFELPFISMITNLAENINAIIEELPRHLLTWAANRACSKVPLTIGNHAALACRWMAVVIDALDYADVTQRGFNKPMSDNAICLEALCNKEDGDCKLSYNKVESLTQFTDYLQVNNWIKDQEKQTGTTPQSSNAAKKLFANHDADIQDEYYLSCSARGSCAPLTQDHLNKYYLSSAGTHWRAVVVDDVPFSQRAIPLSDKSKAALKKLGKDKVDPEVFGFGRYEKTLEIATTTGSVPKTTDYVDKQPEQKKKVEEMDLFKESAEQAALISQYQIMDERWERLDEKANEIRKDATISDEKKRNKLVEIGKRKGAIDEERGEITTELKEKGVAVDIKGGKLTWSHKTSTIKAATEDEAWTKLAAQHPDLAVQAKLEQNEDGWACGSDCQAVLMKSCGEKGSCSIGPYDLEYEAVDEGWEFTAETEITEDINSGQTHFEKKEVGAWGKLLVSTVIQIFRDKGYLNWLSISYWGDWGADLVETSNTYLTKEGWATNICNDFEFDINDNDDGAVYLLTEENNPQPVGTFAAEVRPLSNDIEGKERQYHYLITILVDNPEREAPSGFDDTQWAERNMYKLDAKLLDPVQGSCTASDCPNEIDLVSGTFDLQYGSKFASGNGPKKSMFVSNIRYDRICLLFDKKFPDGNGKRTYCRSVKEDAYERGSPYIPTDDVLIVGGDTSVPEEGSGDGTLLGDLG